MKEDYDNISFTIIGTNFLKLQIQNEIYAIFKAVWKDTVFFKLV